MQPKTRKLILTSIAAIFVIAAAVVYWQWNKPHKNVEDADAIEINAVDLYRIFTSDSAKARLLYVDKVLKVTGEIDKISFNQQAQQVILLKTGIDAAYINCTMEKKNNGCKSGEKIAIKAICSGYISGDADMGLPGDVFLIRGY